MKNLEWLKTTLIAHRGLHTPDKSVPENSLLAFSKAIEKGYGIELDINILKDGTVVVFHDKDLLRLCNHPGVLKDLNWEGLQQFNLYDTSEKIPTLTEVLDLVSGKVPLLIELKHHGDSLLLSERMMDIMKNYTGTWAMHSFHPSIVNWFHKNHPEVIRGQISEYFQEEKTMKKFTKWLLKSLFLNRFTKPDFINYGIKDMPNKYLDKAMKKGLIVIGYASRTQAEFDFVKARYHNSVFEFFEPKNIT